MGTALSLKLFGLRRLQKKLSDPPLAGKLENISKEKGVVALVQQAISENFNQEGPGWAPLKAQTIRTSVAKKLKKQLSKMSDKQILMHERFSRVSKTQGQPFRKILQKSGLLRNTVTQIGYHGSSKDGKISGGNVYKTEGHNLIWGTDLVYSAVHNKGLPKKNIPKREFLKLQPQWVIEINDFVIKKAKKVIMDSLKGSG